MVGFQKWGVAGVGRSRVRRLPYGRSKSQFQQNLKRFNIGIILMVARNNRFKTLLPRPPEVLVAMIKSSQVRSSVSAEANALGADSPVTFIFSCEGEPLNLLVAECGSFAARGHLASLWSLL